MVMGREQGGRSGGLAGERARGLAGDPTSACPAACPSPLPLFFPAARPMTAPSLPSSCSDKIATNDRQLACARIQSKEGQDYLAGMACAANYAWVNR